MSPHVNQYLLTSLAINRITALKAHEKVKVLHIASTTKDFCALTPFTLMRLLSRRLRFKHFNLNRYIFDAQQDLAYINSRAIQLISQSELPHQLRAIHDPPFLLFLLGAPLQEQDQMVGVVGTRKPSPAGVQAATNTGRECAQAGISLVSGLAVGIDSIAMSAALSGSGRVIAVLGNGIDSVYPRSNQELYNTILSSGGTVISEYPPGDAPARYHFPARNRIINGLSSAVILVEAPERSGALITADFALQEGRDLYIHSLPLKSAQNDGGRSLVQAGAPTINALQDIESSLSLEPQLDPQPVAPLSQNSSSTSSGTAALGHSSSTQPQVPNSHPAVPPNDIQHHNAPHTSLPSSYLANLLKQELLHDI